MDYSGPDAADFANVAALNRAFVRRLRSSSRGRRLREGIPAELRETLRRISGNQVDRLSSSPFLLLSLREHDNACWSGIFSGEVSTDMFACGPDDDADITLAATSFLWQLVRRNPYAARIVSGADRDWCDRLAGITLQDLLERTGARGNIIRARFADSPVCWQKLLGAGISARPQIRESAHLACLQVLLTDTRHSRPRRLRAAACSRPMPAATRAVRPG